MEVFTKRIAVKSQFEGLTILRHSCDRVKPVYLRHGSRCMWNPTIFSSPIVYSTDFHVKVKHILAIQIAGSLYHNENHFKTISSYSSRFILRSLAV